MTIELNRIADVAPISDIKLAFFDIDGTLLDKEGNYSKALQKQLLRIQKQGVKTAIASGRPHFAAQFIVDELNLSDVGVFCTGAHIFDPKLKQSLKTIAIDEAVCYSFLTELRKHNLYYELYTDAQYFVENEFASHIQKVHSYHLRCQPNVFDMGQVIQRQAVIKFLIGVDQTIETTLLKTLEEQFPMLTFAYACLPAYPQWQFASIISNDASKRTAFHFLMDYYDIEPKNVISFGDAQSDKVFLELAGVGVAMGNAADDVKAVATFVTKPSWEDGVAYAISRLIE